jgi:transcriptional regulator with XRE-family HTH domain
MEKELVAKYLKQLKDKTGLTYGDIADKSKRSESSVKNLFFGNVDDPRMDTVAPIVYALGGSIDEMLNPGKSRDELKEVSVAQLREMYEMQIATMKDTNEAHINNIRMHYEQHREDVTKNY